MIHNIKKKLAVLTLVLVVSALILVLVPTIVNAVSTNPELADSTVPGETPPFLQSSPWLWTGIGLWIIALGLGAGYVLCAFLFPQPQPVADYQTFSKGALADTERLDYDYDEEDTPDSVKDTLNEKAGPYAERADDLEDAPPYAERTDDLEKAPLYAERADDLEEAPPYAERADDLEDAPLFAERTDELEKAPLFAERTETLYETPPRPQQMVIDELILSGKEDKLPDEKLSSYLEQDYNLSGSLLGEEPAAVDKHFLSDAEQSYLNTEIPIGTRLMDILKDTPSRIEQEDYYQEPSPKVEPIFNDEPILSSFREPAPAPVNSSFPPGCYMSRRKTAKMPQFPQAAGNLTNEPAVRIRTSSLPPIQTTRDKVPVSV